jgi:hypothetical protein
MTSCFSSEQQHQEALFQWANKQIEEGRESLRLLGAIPNGIRMLRWPALKNYARTGFRVGMPDIYFLKPCGGYNGLFIELKSEKSTAKTSPAQEIMLRLLRENGYRAVVCFGCEQAVDTINAYEGK